MTTYPLSLPSLKVLIANADRTAEVLARTLHVRSVLNSQNDICGFEMKSPESWRGAATLKPLVGQTIEVQVQTGTGPFQTLFGGTISRAQEVRMAYKTVKWIIECRDYTALLQQNLVNKRYNNSRIDTIVHDVVSTYAPSVIIDGNVQSCATVIDTVTFTYAYPKDCLDKLAQAVGYQWYVDPFKVLHFYLPGPSTKLSPNTITDTSNNFNELAVEPQLDQVRNRIYVRGGNSFSTASEEFVCNGVTRDFQLSNYPVTMIISTVDGNNVPLRTNALTIDGVAQIVGLQGTADESVYQGGWLLDATNGKLFATDTATTPPDLASVRITYQVNIPIAVMREDTFSQRTVALLESGTYANSILRDHPAHWWRLGDVGGTSAFNSGPAPATNQARYGGTYIGSTERPAAGALVADQQGSTTFRHGWVQTPSGAVWPVPQYTVEAWVQSAPIANATVVHNLQAAGYGQSLVVDTTYKLRQTDSLGYASEIAAPVTPTSAGFDHVVGTFDGASTARLWVNNQQVASGNIAPVGSVVYGPTIVMGSGGITGMQEVALYNYVLSGSQIAAHYHAGRFAGVREYLINDNNLTSFDDARTVGDLQLSNWSAVVTNVTFNSYVSGWKVGDTINVSITASGLGRAYTGTPVIQEVDFDWIGAQRVFYKVSCVESRFNFIDYQRLLAKQRDKIPGQKANLDYITNRTGQCVIIDAIGVVITSTAPFLVEPDPWGIMTVPISRVNSAQVNRGIW